MQNCHSVNAISAADNSCSRNTHEFTWYESAGPIPAPPRGRTWASLMQQAISEAEKAARAGDVPVGAIVVCQDGRIAGRGGNRVEQDKDPAAHAEIVAIRAAAKYMSSPRLGGAILVSTLEPCLMCAAAIAHAHISGLVYGASDPAAGAILSACDMETLPMGSNKFWHLGGVLSRECAEILNNFFAGLRGRIQP